MGIDILPPCIRNNGLGALPVVLFGNAHVDVNDIDFATVELEGMPVLRVAEGPAAVTIPLSGWPKRWRDAVLPAAPARPYCRHEPEHCGWKGRGWPESNKSWHWP